MTAGATSAGLRGLSRVNPAAAEWLDGGFEVFLDKLAYSWLTGTCSLPALVAEWLEGGFEVFLDKLAYSWLTGACSLPALQAPGYGV